MHVFKFPVGLGFLAVLSMQQSLSAQPAITTTVIEASLETDPIPQGKDDTDDPAIWVHPSDPERSLILGTSKYDGPDLPGGGLGVYNLAGHELQYLAVGKLNNVDILRGPDQQNYAVASNRSTNSISIFSIDTQDSKLSFIVDQKIFALNREGLEPYGLCASGQNSEASEVFVTFKNGVIQRYELSSRKPLQLNFKESFDLKSEINLSMDAKIIKNIVLELIEDDELDELEETLAERFIIEGCAYDSYYKRLLVGMEKLGVFALDVGERLEKPRLVLEVNSSYTNVKAQSNPPESYLLTDDVEGIAIAAAGNGQGQIVVSSQGISEYVVIDRQTLDYLGRFRLNFGSDAITQTDGLAIATDLYSSAFPNGLMVVHDDENLGSDESSLDNANFKVVSWQAVQHALGL